MYDGDEIGFNQYSPSDFVLKNDYYELENKVDELKNDVQELEKEIAELRGILRDDKGDWKFQRDYKI